MVAHTNLSPNNSGARAHSIDRISPHCVVGQCTAEGLGAWFAKSSTKASSNYGIDKDGRVGLYVEEKNRSWCTSSAANDNRAVTIECASDAASPYTMNDAVYQTLIRLCADICQRNGKSKIIWMSDKTKALAYEPAGNEMLFTVHCWFANKSCPGPWLMARMDDLAAKVNAILSGEHPVLQNGCTGDDVKALQKALLELGYDLGEYGADGDFGDTTENAVKAYQTDNKLKADGIVGPATWATLDGEIIDVKDDDPAASDDVRVKLKSARPIYKEPPVEVGTCGEGVYTIVEKRNGFGRLKSGAGWVSLSDAVSVEFPYSEK